MPHNSMRDGGRHSTKRGGGGSGGSGGRHGLSSSCVSDSGDGYLRTVDAVPVAQGYTRQPGDVYEIEMNELDHEQERFGNFQGDPPSTKTRICNLVFVVLVLLVGALSYTLGHGHGLNGSEPPLATPQKITRGPPPIPEPTHCIGKWVAWSACSEQCGAGTRNSVFMISQFDRDAGLACEFSAGERKVEACKVKECPVDCVGVYGAWGACSKSCGAGVSAAVFAVTKKSAHGGVACHAVGSRKTRACTVKACPVDCKGRYGAWSACSKSCGSGSQKQTFTIKHPAAHGGKACAAGDGNVQSQACKVRDCPVKVDCAGSWTAWGSHRGRGTCSKACGAGVHSAMYIVTKAAANGGRACPVANLATRVQSCTAKDCPVDCVGAWSPFSTCSKTCGAGYQVSKFKITTTAAHGGKACKTTDKGAKSRACSVRDCPCAGAPCKLGGKCSDKHGKASCACTAGRGGATCTSTVQCPANAVGLPCKCKSGYRSNHNDKTTIAWDASQQVYTSVCVLVDPCKAGTDDCDGNAVCSRSGPGTHACTCRSGFWGTGKTCSKWRACGAGWAESRAPSNKADRQCKRESVDCTGVWSAWSSCSHVCGSGSQSKSFRITRSAAYGGAACAAKAGARASQSCFDKACQIHCVGAYGAWSACSKTCGVGTQQATYAISKSAQHGGKACARSAGATTRRTCSVKACPPPPPPPKPPPPPAGGGGSAWAKMPKKYYCKTKQSQPYSSLARCKSRCIAKAACKGIMHDPSDNDCYTCTNTASSGSSSYYYVYKLTRGTPPPPPPSPTSKCASDLLTVVYRGRRYRTLGQTRHSSSGSKCQRSYRRMPNGWSVAVNDAASRYVATWQWQTHELVLADGSAWNHYQKRFSWTPSKRKPHALGRNGNKYRVNACYRQVLISQPCSGSHGAGSAHYSCDDARWKDSDGDGCSDYSASCRPGWRVYSVKGVSALEVCSQCKRLNSGNVCNKGGGSGAAAKWSFRSHTFCGTVIDQSLSLSTAKSRCALSQSCIGIYDGGCDGGWHMCISGGGIHKSSSGSCVYKKQ